MKRYPGCVTDLLPLVSVSILTIVVYCVSDKSCYFMIHIFFYHSNCYKIILLSHIFFEFQWTQLLSQFRNLTIYLNQLGSFNAFYVTLMPKNVNHFFYSFLMFRQYYDTLENMNYNFCLFILIYEFFCLHSTLQKFCKAFKIGFFNRTILLL